MKEKLIKIPFNNITPLGWYKDVLHLQVKGLTGNISEMWEDLSEQSSWLGGSGEAWERGPYYFDGLLPLSELTKGDKLQKKSKIWLEAILSSQRENGDFGPIINPDWWPRMVVLKTLVRYNESFQDERVIPFLLSYFKYQYDNIDKYPLKFWASARALEAFEAIEYTYNATKESFLLDLIEKLKSYMYNWFEMFCDYPYKEPMSKYVPRIPFKIGKAILEKADKIFKINQKANKPTDKKATYKFNNRKLMKTLMETHGVNIAMALKYPVQYGYITKSEELINLGKIGYEEIMKYHGTAIGLFSSDEHVMGTSPSQGTELCTVVEAMYSFEEMLRLTGDIFYADILEYLFYNALPATFTDDLCAHQYVQQANQISADKKSRQFFDTNKEANIFGIEPNFGCCMANMHQGFTKISECLALKNEKSLTFMVYAPITINEMLNGEKISITATGDYPFRDKLDFVINTSISSNITLRFRIPPNASVKVSLNKKQINVKIEDRFITLNEDLKANDLLTIDLVMQTTILNNPDGSVSVKRGSLLFAFPLEETEIYVRGEKPFHYRHFKSNTKWNVAPLINNLQFIVKDVIFNDINKKPFDTKNNSISLKVEGVEVVNWKMKKNSASAVPTTPVAGEKKELTLVPYGATNLRIAHFPKVEIKEV